jgi:hypothetical protein
MIFPIVRMGIRGAMMISKNPNIRILSVVIPTSTFEMREILVSFFDKVIIV